MSLKVKEFLAALAPFMATSAGIEHVNTPRALWIGEAIEADATACYSVLRAYDASVGYTPLPEASIQIATEGEKNQDDAAWEQAQKLVLSLTEPPGSGISGGRPLRNVTLGSPASFRLVGILDLRGPGQIARNERGGVKLVSNFRALYHAVA